VVAEALEAELVDDAVRHQGDDVRRGRDAVAVPHVFRCGRATEDRAPLQHEDIEAGFGEVRGAREAVVASADDDGVSLPPPHGGGAYMAGWSRSRTAIRARRTHRTCTRGCPRSPTRTLGRTTRSLRTPERDDAGLRRLSRRTRRPRGGRRRACPR